MIRLPATSLGSENNRGFVPPPYETPHSVRQFREIMAEVAQVIAPVWPLKDYVAVNPYSGLSHQNFLSARAFLKVFSDCETLMPMDHYAAEFQQGNFSLLDIQSAVAELGSHAASLSAEQIVERLQAIPSQTTSTDGQPASKSNSDRCIRTIAEHASCPSGVDWTAAIVDEISKHCSDHYDEGQATWISPHRSLPLYQAWRTVAQHDYNIEILGLRRFRQYVAQLPHTPEAAIVYSLQRLQVPQPLWSTFLLCQAFSIPGWSAWTKYQSSWTADEGQEKTDLTDLLAIRLAYDAALAEAQSLSICWDSLITDGAVSFPFPAAVPNDDSMLRYTLLRASEIGFRNRMLESLSVTDDEPPQKDVDRKLAQMVFCIDVRSERIRRHLEMQSDDIETFGFAGFFGLGFEYVTIGQSTGNSQLPVLLKPQFKLYEGFHASDSAAEKQVLANRGRVRSWRTLWKSFQASAVGCFSVVETTGLFYGFKLLARVLRYDPKPLDAKFDGVPKQERSKLGPTLRGLNQQGITTSRQTDLAESMLRNLGLIKDFARLVVFCGHACTTQNNPLAAGLECGACGGHSGEPNARLAAMLLNQPYVRKALADRGIVIPADTHFLGAIHNTTLDSIEFFDVQDLPQHLHESLQELIGNCAVASQLTQHERLPVVGSDSLSELLQRGSDWSEVRPEWGLAGNAAFIAAPRWITKNANLDGRSFLHSYDHRQDTDGSVLETIMTAPMVVAHWINMQYYASTVDNQHFGSGNKTVHNVVGRFGIVAGNGGDLMTGLPWQSLHAGTKLQHLPLRLQVVIAAPREMIDRVIVKHEMLANLLSGNWLHLIAIEDNSMYCYGEIGTWDPIQVNRAPQLARS